MKTKKKKYLEFYFDPDKEFLCLAFEDDDLFAIMKPTVEELIYLFPCYQSTIQINGIDCAWGSFTDNGCWMSGFNPLRQNIVLFMAAMNDEL